jgi:glycosyltransferase involved in cell wall biosynthesis
LGEETTHQTLSGTPVIVFVGRLVTTKGLRVLFEAAKILQEQNRPFELLVIGEGPERAALEQFARDSRIATQVRFAGCLDGEQVDQALAQASAVVVPSIAGEVFGLVVVENMLRGLPLVTSNLGSFIEVLGDTGLTFRSGEAADLAAALARLLDDPSFASVLGRRARQRALDFYSKGRMIEAHLRVYGDVCASAKT